MKKLLNLKRLLKARNSSGFTLVEVILSCALLSILILGIMMFVTPVLKMVTSGQKNARATMLSETVDTYIAGVLRTAKKIEVFENIEFSSSSSGDLDLSSYGSGIGNISTFMSDGDNALNYEVRALALVCKDEGEITTQGVRLYNAEVDASTLNLKASSIDPKNQALNDLMFEGLYATIFLENFAEQDEITGAPKDGTNAKGYKISTVVYNDPKCYDPTQEVRDKSIQAFVGVTFFQALNISAGDLSTIIDPYGYDPANRNTAIQAAMDTHGEPGDGKLYYPATIIYYVAPKK
ncbi:MAG: prepilin-type N-terminal cleavage/methylation domain-containing protein [Oscillospiraceae bacterium]|nr:prepilin-type N-terminal cleavage/methylation domain-containing protein [Oscillospiraceae bacterium]